MVPGPGKTVKILTQTEAAQSELEIGVGTENNSGTTNDHMMTQVIPLKFVNAADIKTNVKVSHENPFLKRVMSVIHNYYRPALHWCLARPKLTRRFGVL